MLRCSACGEFIYEFCHFEQLLLPATIYSFVLSYTVTVTIRHGPYDTARRSMARRAISLPKLRDRRAARNPCLHEDGGLYGSEIYLLSSLFLFNIKLFRAVFIAHSMRMSESKWEWEKPLLLYNLVDRECAYGIQNNINSVVVFLFCLNWRLLVCMVYTFSMRMGARKNKIKLKNRLNAYSLFTSLYCSMCV